MLSATVTPATHRPLALNDILGHLLDDRLINEQQSHQLRLLSTRRSRDAEHPLIHISKLGWQSATRPSYPLTLERLTRWLAEKVKLPYLRIDPLKIDVASVTGLVSQAYASRFRFLPIKVNSNIVVVATAEPFIREWEAELARILRRRIQRVVSNPTEIDRYLTEFYGVSRSIFGANTSRVGSPISELQNFEQLVELGKIGEVDANDKHVVHIVDWLLQYAFEQRASDIHLEPRRGHGHIRFRIDGALRLVRELPPSVLNAISSRLKSLGRMDVTDKRRPQDGRIKTKTPAGKEIEMRLSTMPTACGEKLVMRIFDPQVLSKSFVELGFGQEDLELWKHMVEAPHGIVLVTGPTGSGKTTTLYSTLKQIARPELNICTIEDPIEMVEPQFNQMQVQPTIDLGFAAGVRTLLRQDPDVIMVGEIRDYETATVAIQAALTGHLVLSTLHTNDAPSAITRLMDIGIPPYLISATLIGVIAQRLVRTLCPHCKRSGSVDADAWEALVAPETTPPPSGVMEAPGCDECRNTGYLGRTGLYEILRMTNPIRRCVKPEVDIATLRSQAVHQGMRRLRVSGAAKIAEGMTSLDEVLTAVPLRNE